MKKQTLLLHAVLLYEKLKYRCDCVQSTEPWTCDYNIYMHLTDAFIQSKYIIINLYNKNIRIFVMWRAGISITQSVDHPNTHTCLQTNTNSSGDDLWPLPAKQEGHGTDGSIWLVKQSSRDWNDRTYKPHSANQPTNPVKCTSRPCDTAVLVPNSWLSACENQQQTEQ